MEGLRFVPAQARRIAGMLDAVDEWDVRRPAGWTPKEMFAHVSAIMGTTPMFGRSILKAPPDMDIIQGMDIAEYNEQGVAPMRSSDPKQVVETLTAHCGKMSEWVAGLTDEQLDSRHKFRGMPMTMSDFLMTVTVMHALHHLFEAPLSVPA